MFTIYKEDKTQKVHHSIDLPEWLEMGWSLDPPTKPKRKRRNADKNKHEGSGESF